MSYTNLRSAAYHESGHCVVYRVFDLPLFGVRVDDDGGGETHGLKPKRLSRRRRLMLQLAGIVAECIAGSDPPLDEYHAALARNDSKLVEQCYRDTEAILRANWSRVIKIALALIKNRELHGSDVRDICRGMSETSGGAAPMPHVIAIE